MTASARSLPRPAILAIVIALLMTTGMLIPLPRGNWFIIALLNMAHAPAFALLSFFVMWFARGRVSWWLAACLTVLVAASLGAGTEWLQTFVGREVSWEDFQADLVGGVIGVLLNIPQAVVTGRRWLAWICVTGVSCVLVASVSQYSLSILLDMALRDPDPALLGSFETRWELSRWYGESVRCRPTTDFVTHGEQGLHIQFSPEPQYASFRLARMARDWTPYRSLVLDIYLPGETAAELHIKVHDEAHNDEPEDRFNGTLRLRPGGHRYTINLSDIAAAPQGRPMDMQRVKTLTLFTANLQAPLNIVLDHIRLQ